ncbi:MAG: hypothetical protein ABIR00_04345 [Nitrosospira sp.]
MPDIHFQIEAKLNPDNSLGREMMARQVARQFCRLREVHSLVYGRRAGSKNGGENGRKLTASTRVGSQNRLMNYLG